MAKRRLGVRTKLRKFRPVINIDPLDAAKSKDDAGYWDATVQTRSKWNSTSRPWAVSNEFICGEIGRFLRLPIPAFGITYADDAEHRQLFTSLNFNFDGRDLRPVRPDRCYATQPDLCAGILAFDILIANSDRHNNNLAVDNEDAPQVIQVFDHDIALFGHFHFGGIDRLKYLNGKLGVTAGPRTGGWRELFLDLVNDNSLFIDWIRKIRNIPESFITDVCNEAKDYGLSPDEATEATKFLLSRRTDLAGIMARHKNEFKGIARWKSL